MACMRRDYKGNVSISRGMCLYRSYIEIAQDCQRTSKYTKPRYNISIYLRVSISLYILTCISSETSAGVASPPAANVTTGSLQ